MASAAEPSPFGAFRALTSNLEKTILGPPAAPEEGPRSAFSFLNDSSFQIKMGVIASLALSALFIIGCMATHGSFTNLQTLAPTVVALTGVTFFSLLLTGTYKSKERRRDLIILSLATAVILTLGSLGIAGLVPAKPIGISIVCAPFCVVLLPLLVCSIHAWRRCHPA